MPEYDKSLEGTDNGLVRPLQTVRVSLTPETLSVQPEPKIEKVTSKRDRADLPVERSAYKSERTG